jgi:membrane bound O-acyltransferase family protein
VPTVSASQPAISGTLFEALPLFILPALVIAIRDRMPAWLFMWALAFSIFAGLKWITWLRARDKVSHAARRSVAYLLAWPGMDAENFLDSRAIPLPPVTSEWLWAATKMLLGATLLWVIARRIPSQEALLRGWIGLFGLILILHFGSFDLIALFWQARGIEADPIMAQPIRSKSLSEFWGKRWNLGFRQLAHDLIFRPLHRRIGVALAGFLVFLVSGLIHDLVISLPARRGYGLPTAYFILQGLGVALERSSVGNWLGMRQGVRGWLSMLVITAGPVFWLFHPPFVLRVIIPFMHAIHAV